MFVVVDRFEHDDREKIWTMHVEEEVTIGDRGFTLHAASGATLKGTFIAPSPVRIAFEPHETGGKIMATGGSE
ncbi:MAG: hypothetical protein AB4290_26415, partial [Spirulina sp.]